jgi:hypothetical protein
VKNVFVFFSLILIIYNIFRIYITLCVGQIEVKKKILRPNDGGDMIAWAFLI